MTRHVLTAVVLCCATAFATIRPALAAEPSEDAKPGASRSPYLPSPVIKGLTIEPDRQSIGDGDNWPITWGDDGDQYTVYCDGEGFRGGSGKGSMSLAKIMGSPPDLAGRNLESPSGHKTGGGAGGRKASGLVMVDGVLYMWVRNLNKDGTGSSLAWSKDRAKTWTWATWSFPEIGYPVWLNAGRNYSAAEDEYAYFYSPDTPSAYRTSDHVMMGRVPKDAITRRDAYRFFAGLDGQGRPRWTAELNRRRPVFSDPGHCYRPEVVYHPGIRRYLLCTATSGSVRWCGTDSKYLGIFDAPSPWGPWTVVKQIDGWGGRENRFQPRIPSKWISEDGASFYLLYSCFPEGPYQFNVQKCNLKTAEGVCLDAVSVFEIGIRKNEDRVQAALKGDQALFVIASPSGIGSTTIKPTAASWPKTMVVRVHLRGLESLSVSNGRVKLSASVLSHGNHMRLLHLWKAGQEKKVEQGSPYWMEIKIVDAAGKPSQGLPGPGGYFEMTLPGALLEGNPKSLTLGWIDFYRS